MKGPNKEADPCADLDEEVQKAFAASMEAFHARQAAEKTSEGDIEALRRLEQEAQQKSVEATQALLDCRKKHGSKTADTLSNTIH